MSKNAEHQLALLISAVWAQLEKVAAANRVLESVTVCLAATHPDKELLLKLIEEQMEYDVAEDLNSPIHDDQAEVFEKQRARLLRRFRTVCRAKASRR